MDGESGFSEYQCAFDFDSAVRNDMNDSQNSDSFGNRNMESQ